MISSPYVSCRSSRLSGSTSFSTWTLARQCHVEFHHRASANFLAILFAALAFRTEKLNTAKVLGCVLGFAGVALVNLSGADGTFGFTLDGEGFILASTVAGALSTCLIGIFSREHDGVLLAGWQFLVGGLALTAIGFLMGGALSPTAIAPAITLIIYMALISAVAYSLWSRLLAVNPVSRVSVFGFMNPSLVCC